MAEFVYPALFRVNEYGSYTVTFPDLPGCISEGKSLGNTLLQAENALGQWLEYLLQTSALPLPVASPLKDVKPTKEEFVNYVRAQVRDDRAVKRTVSIPKWMDDKVAQTGLSLSKVLQDALRERLNTD